MSQKCVQNNIMIQTHVGYAYQIAIFTDEVASSAGLVINIILVVSIGCNKCNKRHFILGQSTSLIRADNSDTTKCLNCRELSDDSIVLGHVSNTPTVGHSDNSLKTFRDHSNSTNKSNGESIKRGGIDLEVCNQPSDDCKRGNNTSKYQVSSQHHLAWIKITSLSLPAVTAMKQAKTLETKSICSSTAVFLSSC